MYKKDPLRPFSIDLGEHAVTVLGTEFNVYRQPGRYQVSVVEGVVAFHQAEATVQQDSPSLAEGVRADSAQSNVYVKKPGQRRITAGWVAEYDIAKNSMSGHVPEKNGRASSVAHRHDRISQAAVVRSRKNLKPLYRKENIDRRPDCNER